MCHSKLLKISAVDKKVFQTKKFSKTVQVLLKVTLFAVNIFGIIDEQSNIKMQWKC